LSIHNHWPGLVSIVFVFRAWSGFWTCTARGFAPTTASCTTTSRPARPSCWTTLGSLQGPGKPQDQCRSPLTQGGPLWWVSAFFLQQTSYIFYSIEAWLFWGRWLSACLTGKYYFMELGFQARDGGGERRTAELQSSRREVVTFTSNPTTSTTHKNYTTKRIKSANKE